jgi:DNA-binding NarL/FixJ family response regulator
VVLQGTSFVPISLIEDLPVTEDRSEFAKLPSLSSETRGSSLTPRQRQVLQLLVSGQSNKEIARSLNLREGTVKVHMSALFRNLGVANRIAAAVVGARTLWETDGVR